MLGSNYHRRVSAGRIFLWALRFYGDRFNVLFLPFLIVSLAKSILWKFALDVIPQLEVQPGFTENFLVQFINYLTFVIPILIFFTLISWVIDILPNGMIVKYSADHLEGRTPSLTSSLKTVISQIFSLLLIELIRGLLVILGLVLFIIPGIIMAVVFSLAIQVMIIERSGIFESLRRSRKLVAKEPWQVFLVLLFIFLLSAIGGVVGEIFSNHLIRTGNYVRLIIISIIMSLAKPLQPVALTYLYYSLSADQKLIVTREQYQPIVPTPQQTGQRFQEPIGYHPKFCYKCGQKLPPDAIYCPRCGVRVRT